MDGYLAIVCRHLGGMTDQSAGIAQLAEQLICNQWVVGSSPTTSSISGCGAVGSALDLGSRAGPLTSLMYKGL